MLFRVVLLRNLLLQLLLSSIWHLWCLSVCLDEQCVCGDSGTHTCRAHGEIKYRATAAMGTYVNTTEIFYTDSEILRTFCCTDSPY